MNKFVIYTVLTGGYDRILQPVVTDNRFDYILFTDDVTDDKIGVWDVKEIPDVISADTKRLSRYPKTHPETMLSNYDASLYIDANIQIQDQWVYDRFVELFEANVIFAGIQLVLTGRDCIYQHAFDICHSYCLEHDFVAIRQCHELLKRKFPTHFGMNENNVIFRIHTDQMKKADEEWWEWITTRSARDQLSYMYCLWNNQIPLHYFLPQGEDTRNGSHFSLINHDADPKVIKIKVIKRSLLEKLRVRAFLYNEEKGYNRWMKIARSKHPELNLYITGIGLIIFNIPSFIKEFFFKR